ncbi:hypothetical protein U8527_04280 [Kordia algicida OT-1]|uniref:Uncharacterized protein n=1 Tax=Kordia algicida OT-1 TaxID=391587 RepID=A9DPW5_9FLAO|nr:hypothetical protein [Kordia algicida]EDP97539.1 hypothetical protein KAOT1_20292 [Kordia algicida OT-1]
MKFRIFLICLLNAFILNANMASPVQEGTLGTRPFLSQYVHILHENLRITIDKNFQYADFDIEYIINAEKDGNQIPLLFYASDYYENFEVYIDGKKITLQKQEDFWDLYGDDKEKLTNFHYLYNADRKEVGEIENNFQYGRSDRISLNDFLYFETDISTGKHSIKVSYRASNWRFKHNRLNEDSFRYALAPAKYWKSFGTLDVTIDATKVQDNIAINLGTPKSGEINGIANYHFDKMPLEIIQITRMPKLSSYTKFLLNLESFWLAIILMSLIVIFHVWRMYLYRKKYPKKKFSSPAFIGAVLIPFLFIFMLILTTLWIDAAIGEPYASGRESYGAFFQFLYLPKYLGIYVLFSIIVDFIFKKIHGKKS